MSWCDLIKPHAFFAVPHTPSTVSVISLGWFEFLFLLFCFFMIVISEIYLRRIRRTYHSFINTCNGILIVNTDDDVLKSWLARTGNRNEYLQAFCNWPCIFCHLKPANFSVSDIFYLNSKSTPHLIEKIRDCGASMNMLLKNLFNLKNIKHSHKLTYGKRFLACKPIIFMWTLALKNLCLWGDSFDFFTTIWLILEFW